MKWKLFFTPVKSFSANEAKKFINSKSGGAFTFLDVRQPEEYKDNHIPGATLIPLPDLSGRMAEIDPKKPTIVYCAIGGRSRVAAQMLAGNGFKEVYNLTGGIKAWNGESAFGPEDLGIDLFSGNESPEETLLIAYSLEAGLKDFYMSMIPQVSDDKTRRLFEQLAAIEIKHQDRIFGEYITLSGNDIAREYFEKQIITPAMEGGLTTEAYLSRYHPDMNVVSDIVSMAMAIEAQALDLYHRASERASTEKSKEMLLRIADEEREHLKRLGTLFETGEQ